jgi:hypothetical protein
MTLIYDHLQFKELNSKLNREVMEFERAKAVGTHRLAGGEDVYQPSSELEAEAHVHILGGGGQYSGLVVEESREERRQKVLDATITRLQKLEEEIENGCGTVRHPA